jgi:thioredoxin-like negative regulator of GroEL
VKTLGLAWLLVATACAGMPRTTPAIPRSPAPLTAPLAGEGPIAFVENDYARALADARALKRPLFVDAWATWCHTCLSMRSYVFPDPALRPLAGRFVWLSIDTERQENAALVSKLAVRALPTLYVIEPASEKPILAWAGSLTASELAGLLEDAAVAVAHGDAGGRAAAALLRGHRASAEGKPDDAVGAYREALAAAPLGWPKRAQAVDALVARLADDKRLAECVILGADEALKMPPGTGLADVLRTAIGCAEELPAGAPERGRLGELAVLGEQVASDRSQPILADDRSDLYDHVVGALRAIGRGDDVKRVARAWGGFLEQQAAGAPTRAARAVFDAHRLLAYMAVGEQYRALPMLEQSELDFPDDYNPPARLAVAYLAMGQHDEALAALKRAMGRAYGPRKLRLWSLEADVYEAKGDAPSARVALQAALDFAKTVPLTAGYSTLRDAIEQRLARLR